MDTPEIRQAVVLIKALYREHAAGGWLHIVVDDWNVEQCNLDYCATVIDTDVERRCHAALNALTETERASALALDRGFWAA